MKRKTMHLSARIFSVCLVFFIFFVVIVPLVLGQVTEGKLANKITVTTWKRGSAKILPKTFHLILNKNISEYEIDFSDEINSLNFRLRLKREYLKTPMRPKIECWKAELRQIFHDTGAGGNIVGHTLLTTEGPGVGDNFPKEDWAPFFCSMPPPVMPFDDRFYPIRTERRFLIEKFVMIFDTSNYEYDQKDGGLNKLDLRIQLVNQEPQ